MSFDESKIPGWTFMMPQSVWSACCVQMFQYQERYLCYQPRPSGRDGNNLKTIKVFSGRPRAAEKSQTSLLSFQDSLGWAPPCRSIMEEFLATISRDDNLMMTLRQLQSSYVSSLYSLYTPRNFSRFSS